MLRNIKIPGRFEILQINKNTVIIDGAHNPQKMETFTKNLSVVYPQQKFTFIVTFKKNKDYKKILNKIIPLANKIFLTSFSLTNQENHQSSVNNELIKKYLKSKNFENFKAIPNKHSHILENVRMSKKPVVITDSLYLIGSIYSFLK